MVPAVIPPYEMARTDLAEGDLTALKIERDHCDVSGADGDELGSSTSETGFDKLLLRLIHEGMAYIGTSAGAYITCPTIEVSTWGPKHHDRYGLRDLTGLNLVPFLLKVHYTDDMEGLVREKIAACKYPVRILRDGQGILANGSDYRFVGEGKEVIL